MTEEMHLGDRTYRNTVVRLVDLAVTSDVITGVTFENCTLVGPAVIVLQGCTMTNSGFDGDPEAIFWPLGDRQRVIGAIALVDCTIAGSRFQRIGLAFPAADETQIRAGFGLG